MPPRRTQTPAVTTDSLSPNHPTALGIQQPRSASPSSGFTQFLTKPSKWFSRSASTSKVPQGPSEPRLSTGSGGRKHKISRPTDPRPILDSYAGPGSRSVLDLSGPQSIERPRFHPPSTPSSPVVSPPHCAAGLGDLRNISRKAWSKSADDLNKVSPANFSPINTSFQDRVAEYRNRSNSSASAVSPSSPTSTHTANGRHPFPTINNTPPSSSPPRSATLPSVSISISAPVLDDGPPPRAGPPLHVHTRSHSFTPKLPSKLANPRYPASPQRSGTAPIDREYDVRELDRIPHGTPTRVAFGFGFGGLAQPKPADSSYPPNHHHHLAAATSTSPSSHRTTTLLPPPTILEPGRDAHVESEVDTKRSSQIVYHAGFLNRLADIPPNLHHHIHHGQPQLSKGWKAYKVELKGSKLHFYKPPSDKAAGIKELFPSGLVPPSEEEDDLGVPVAEEDGAGRQKKPEGAGTTGRKKRAYWGRRTHPDLIFDATGAVEKGTFEALIHEAVFATTSIYAGRPTPDAQDDAPVDPEAPADDTKDAVDQSGEDAARWKTWRDFASAILLGVPLVVGRQSFESEFLRCCSYLVSGAEDERRDEHKTRVSWLANEYLVAHGDPFDTAAWQEWKDETIPGVVLGAESGPPSSLAAVGTGNDIPTSTSNQAVFDQPTAEGSPNVNTFSPRPDANPPGVVSLLEALFPSLHPSTSGEPPAKPSGSGASTRFPWAGLREEGLSREVMLRFDPHLIAVSLTLFHRSILERAPDNVTASFISPPASDPQTRLSSADYAYDPVYAGLSSTALFGTEDSPHWLTKLVLLQVLGGEGSSSGGTGGGYVLVNNHPPAGGSNPGNPASPPGSGNLSASTSSSSAFPGSPGRRSEDLLRQGQSPQSPHHPHPHHLQQQQQQQPPQQPPQQQQQTSRTHSRSEAISIWAKIGELCRTSGDEVSWRAIRAALCSRPIARLDKVWKRVDPYALVAIEGWAWAGEGATSRASAVQGNSGGGGAKGQIEEEEERKGLGVVQPQVTPWGGDIKERFGACVASAQVEGGTSMVHLGSLVKARDLFEAFRTRYALCPRRAKVTESEVEEDIRRMVSFWKEMAAEGGGASSLAVKFKRVEQFMALSLAAEPRRKGLFEPYFWTRHSASQTPSASLVPLLFPEAMPTVTLVDRSKLIRGRLDSDLSDAQYLKSLDAQLRQEATGRQLHRLDGGQEFTKRLILGHGGTVISVHNGELLLVVQTGGGYESTPNSRPTSSRVTSRPPSSVMDHQGTGGVAVTGGDGKPPLSRNPSIRVKPNSSQGLDRKTSMARRSSLPSVSHLSRQNFVTSEPSSDPPLRVVVQAGTLNNLVNILVHGLESVSVSVADDNGEMSLREGMTRELVVDRQEFSRVWWNVFRSFVTPFVFFELLRKMFMTAQLTGVTVPQTDQHLALILRNEVLTTIREWITLGSGAQDILDDTQLYAAVRDFLELSLDQFVSRQALVDNPALQSTFELVQESKRQVKLTFTSQTMRPSIRSMLAQPPPQPARGARQWINNGTRELPNFDRMDPEEFVDNLDGMAYAAFSNVTQEDLYITADLLEVQTSDRTGWFINRDTPVVEELVEIQTMYSQIQEIEPSNLISELSQDVLYRLLPPGVRSCIRAYAIIRKWLVAKLVAPRLGLRTRQARMELLLQVIEVARLRNAEAPEHTVDQPCVRSFVEAVTTSALVSIESRLHARAWQSVAMSRGASCDSFSSLLLRPYIQSTASRESLTVDMGWLLERMLEIIATPDVIDPSSEETLSLVNFDKRRHLCNLIRNASVLPSSRKTVFSEEAIRRGFERLNSIEKEVLRLQFDHRGIKEDAAREAAQPGMNGAPASKKPIRPFQKVIAIQMEKTRRDKGLRARLQRDKQQELHKSERRDDLLNKAMRPRTKTMSNAQQKQHRNKKSMSAFLSFMRPISSAFGADLSQPLHAVKRTPEELDFPTSAKPALVLSIMDAQVAQFINNERSYTFQLDTEDGGHYLLQAINKREMNKWLEAVSRVTNLAAKRRLTYLGNSPKPQLADHIHHQPIVASRDPQAVFGVELQYLLQRDAGGDYVPPGTVPIVIEQCLSEVEARGLTEVGIYRIAGATKEINGLKDAYNRGEYPIKPTTDIHAICDLIKSWFRVLPEPVFPPQSYRDVMEAMRIENLDHRLVAIRHVVQNLPQHNFDLLRRVSEHLDRVTDYEEHNHMTAEALAIVFSPNLLRAPQNDFVMILNNMGSSHKLVKALITHFHAIFDEADPEAEVHSEDDLESPIPEEEEEDEDNLPDDPQTELNHTDAQSDHDPTESTIPLAQ